MTFNRSFLFLFFSAAAIGCGSQGGAENGSANGGVNGAGAGTGVGGGTGAGAGTAAGGGAGTATGGSSMGGSGATVGVGGATGGSGGSVNTDCVVTASAELSAAIATVGIVTFSTDVANLDRAQIEFGLDTSYGMTAPVDLSEPEYRTLLLGMKQARDYHYRIVVGSGATECASQDYTITTGQLPNILPTIDVTTQQPDKLSGGFLMTGQYEAAGGDSSPAYIIDADGDYVWALSVGDWVTGVRQSYDGKYMWINGTDNSNGGQANIHRVTMDGLVDEDLSDAFGLQDHSITVLPNETVIFYGHDIVDCALVKRRLADGTIEEITNMRDAHEAEGRCHVNFVEYSPDDDTLIFSDDNHSNYTKVTRDGMPVWVLGGETSNFGGSFSMWDRQHGMDVLAVDRLLFFNNRGPTEGSIAVEVQLDLNDMTSTEVWRYESETPIANQQLGDVQRMENGNTIVAYSTQGILHEVDAEGDLVQEMLWPLGGAYGYIIKRPTLYGPPPR